MYRLGTFVLLLCFSAGSPASEAWKWVGFEVIGHKTITRDQVLKFIPIEVGQQYSEKIEHWSKWCENLRQAYALVATECSSVRYHDYKAYFTVEVIEKGDEYRIRYRQAPSKDIPLATAEVMELYGALKKRLWELFNQGRPPKETWVNGYLDYDDRAMHEYVTKLIKLTPRVRRNIINVLRNDKDVKDRMSAADLLNWALNSRESVLEAYSLLDDPNSGVRNQLSRFMMYPVKDIRSIEKLRAIVETLALQLDRPSHGDRNKALYNLVTLTKEKPCLRRFIKSKVGSLARSLVDQSILNNVQDPAKELLGMLNRDGAGCSNNENMPRPIGTDFP